MTFVGGILRRDASSQFLQIPCRSMQWPLGANPCSFARRSRSASTVGDSSNSSTAPQRSQIRKWPISSGTFKTKWLVPPSIPTRRTRPASWNIISVRYTVVASHSFLTPRMWDTESRFTGFRCWDKNSSMALRTAVIRMCDRSQLSNAQARRSAEFFMADSFSH